MTTMSRRCIPYTPNRRELSQTVIALVSNTGVYCSDQQPFDTDSDTSYRVIPGDVESGDLRVRHGHYDQSEAERDVNCIFPIDRLRELAAEGVIGGVAGKHLTMGYSLNVRSVTNETAPAIADEIDRSDADAVLLTAGCPHVCHRMIVAIQREIEMRGIPTIVITVSPDDTKQMGPPRGIYPKAFAPGAVTGHAGQQELQRRVVRDALERLVTPMEPGVIAEHDYPEYRPAQPEAEPVP